jgi:hypothetical protein
MRARSSSSAVSHRPPSTASQSNQRRIHEPKTIVCVASEVTRTESHCTATCSTELDLLVELDIACLLLADDRTEGGADLGLIYGQICLPGHTGSRNVVEMRGEARLTSPPANEMTRV